ncbi:MAG: hypothetical protein SAK42_14655 [Oscillatoria sp. PMC 1076.18]|nr:hypothetical protein [Oscillatoria sp. PMC 1076.18]
MPKSSLSNGSLTQKNLALLRKIPEAKLKFTRNSRFNPDDSGTCINKINSRHLES